MALAEESGLDPAGVDLVTVAQALHWFDIDAFFAEAARVLKPGGIVAFWCYQHCSVNAAIDAVFSRIFAAVEEFWPPERVIVEDEYLHIEMPFIGLPSPAFSISADWTARNVLDYMRTWSATQRYIAARGECPIDRFEAPLAAVWGDEKRVVRWPIVLRVGRK